MSKLVTAFVAGALACSALTVGCSKPEKKSDSESTATTTAAATPDDPAAEAKKYFDTTCVVCHGKDGKGDGPGAAALNPKPRNYTDVKWQEEVKDDELKKAILEGGAAVGKSAAMPPNPQLKSKPKVVDELVKIVRGFKGK
jgi:mono/diheme cytochrome c family protein